MIHVEINNCDRPRADALAKACTSKEGLAVHSDSCWKWFKRVPTRLRISDHGEGCACSLLSDDADWNADTWAMMPSILPRLALTIERLYEEVPEGFVIEALWVGEKATKERNVSVKELLSIARAGTFGTKTRYKVH